MQSDSQMNLLKGLLAGAAAGLAASFVMGQFHAQFQNADSRPTRVAPARADEDSTVKAASALSRAVLRHKLTPAQKKLAGPLMDYAFGATLAGIYGMAVELHPEFSAGRGVPFGMAVWLGAHVIAVPALGLSQPITKSPPRAETIEFGAHLVYGAVTESLRRLMRMGGFRNQAGQ